jgi:esterase/lipase superfamily enzyme
MLLAAAMLLAMLAGCAVPAGVGTGAAGPELVEVPYVTDRARDPGWEGVASYRGERGEPGYGRCRVRFSALPLLGDMAGRMPFYVPGEAVEVTGVERLDRPALWRALEGPEGAPLAVFVHGYSFDLGEGCQVVAVLQRALGERARMMLFSWPSDDNPADYTADRADMAWSAAHLADLLAALRARLDGRPLHLVAHSMGAYGVVEALLRLGCDGARGPLVDELVLIAPDLDQAVFRQHLPRLRRLAGRITLYASDNDTLLTISRVLNGYPRLGEAGRYLMVAEGMETVDVSPLGRHHLTGHEYYRYHPLATRDLVELLATGQGAAKRSLPRPVEGDDGRYWELREAPAPEAADG